MHHSPSVVEVAASGQELIQRTYHDELGIVSPGPNLSVVTRGMFPAVRDNDTNFRATTFQCLVDEWHWIGIDFFILIS